MQYIFKETVIRYEWMPDNVVKEIFDEYAHSLQYSEDASFSIESVLEWSNEKLYFDYVEELEEFMKENAINKTAMVRWSW